MGFKKPSWIAPEPQVGAELEEINQAGEVVCVNPINVRSLPPPPRNPKGSRPMALPRLPRRFPDWRADMQSNLPASHVNDGRNLSYRARRGAAGRCAPAPGPRAQASTIPPPPTAPAPQASHVIIGRNKDAADVAVDHATCSREHAALVFHEKGDLYLIDLK